MLHVYVHACVRVRACVCTRAFMTLCPCVLTLA